MLGRPAPVLNILDVGANGPCKGLLHRQAAQLRFHDKTSPRLLQVPSAGYQRTVRLVSLHLTLPDVMREQGVAAVKG